MSVSNEECNDREGKCYSINRSRKSCALSLTVKLNLASLLDEHDDVAANVDHGVVGGGGGGGGGDKKDEKWRKKN